MGQNQALPLTVDTHAAAAMGESAFAKLDRMPLIKKVNDIPHDFAALVGNLGALNLGAGGDHHEAVALGGFSSISQSTKQPSRNTQNALA